MSVRFFDNHCHILPTGLDLQKLSLVDAHTKEETLALIRSRNADQPGGWLMAVHYDHNRFGGEHVTRFELDEIASNRPIVLRHSSGHAGVVNSSALQLAGIRDSVQDSEGRAFLRDPSGALNGVLLEGAFTMVTNSVPKPTRSEMVQAISDACRSMAAYGIVCACDMQTGSFDLEDELMAYREVAEQGCPVALRLYPQFGRVFGPRGMTPERLNEIQAGMDQARCRVQGIKLFADGAIGAGTAAIYGGYAGDSSQPETSGTLMYKPEKLRERILTAAESGFQVAVHAIGDYAVDLVLDCFEATARPDSHRIEHAMLLSDSQVERLHRVGCFVSVQPEFLGRFGSMYLTMLGSERGSQIIRTRSLIDAGIPLSLSSDRPITSGEPDAALRFAVDRPAGFDPQENIEFAEAEIAHSVSAALVTGDQQLC